MARSECNNDTTPASSSSDDSIGGSGEHNDSTPTEIPSDDGEHSQATKDGLLEAFARSTGYPLVQQNGQRRYGPPQDWTSAPPQKGCEVFVGKLPRDVMEYELVPVFERIGKIYEMRMMMDFNGSNRGYAFVTYCDKQHAKKACQELNGYEIRRGRYIGVLKSVDNCRLYVSGIPRDKTRQDVLTEMSRLTEGVVDVILYPSAVDKSKNRGFAFVEYESHRCAAMARRKLAPNRLTLWGSDITVDWAEPERDVDEETMAQVKKLYIRNLMIHTTEEFIKETVESISGPGTVERVKKIRDYAFVHFSRREEAIKVQEALNNINLDGSVVEVKLAKPPDRSIMRFVKNAQKLAQLYSASLTTMNNGDQVSEMMTAGGKIMPAMATAAETGSPTNASVYMGFPCIDPFAMGPAYPNSVAVPPSHNSSGGGCGGGGGGIGRVTGTGNGSSGGGTGRFIGRGAAGMRAANFQVMLNNTFRRHRFHYVDVLEEHCKQNNWGTPKYRLQTTEQAETGDAIRLYGFNVEIPSLMASCGTFSADQMLPDKQDAKEAAAEHTLNQLGVMMCRQQSETGQHQQEDGGGVVVVNGGGLAGSNIRSPSGDSGISAGSMPSTATVTTTAYEVQQSPLGPVPVPSAAAAAYSSATIGYQTANAAYENYILSDIGAFQPFLWHTIPFATSTAPAAFPTGAWVPSYVSIYNGPYAEPASCFGPTFSVQQQPPPPPPPPPPPALYVNYDINAATFVPSTAAAGGSQQAQSECMTAG